MARPRTTPPAAEAEQKPEPAPEEASEPASDEVAKEEVPSIHVALSRVMGDVQHISKDSRNQSQGFNFRGIDAVMNAVGPALREHGVVVVPVRVKYDSENYNTKSGTAMKNVGLVVTFRFYGPGGDWIEAQARGEAADSGDKATPKAHSVALRTVLLQALCIPTDEPDPDSDSHERAVHESGFQGGSRRDPQARRQGQEGTAYNWPKGPGELAGRMGKLLGVEESREWMKQAVQVATGETLSYAELPQDQQRIAWDVLTKTLRSLDEELKVDPGAFPPPTREEISGEFAKHLDGQVLNGPQWALSGDEAERGYPAKESVLGVAPANTDPQEALESESAEDVPTEQEEAQATLDEEAAAEAEHDRDQAHDASGK